MPGISASRRLHGDVERICEQAKDSLDAALWHYHNRPVCLDELKAAIVLVQAAIDLIEAKEGN